MTQLTEVRTPDLIATEIHVLKGHARDVILQSSIEIGKRLVEAKELVPRGGWGDWLEKSVDYSQATANNLMAIYREYGDKSQALGNLSYTKALALLGVPSDEREQFVADNNVDNLSAREVQKLVKEKQTLEKQLKQSRDEQARLQTQLQQHQSARDQLTAELARAKQQGNEAEVKRLKTELSNSQTRVKNLESELQNKPIDVPGVVEKIPDAVQNELERLRKQVAQSNGSAAVKFRVQFDNLVKGFQDLLVVLAEVESESPGDHDKYKRAVSGLTNKMLERLQ